MTYKKPTIEVNGTTLMGATFSGDANAYEALKAHKTAKVTIDSKDALVPFHAVKEFAKSVVTADAERTDPYCGGGTEPIGEVWYTATVPSGECDSSVYALSMTPTPNARTSELIGNPNAYDVSVNGVVMSFAIAEGGWAAFSDVDLTDYTVALEMSESEQVLDLKCPPRFDAGTDVEVTVTKK